jgi:hypothetical protein
MRWLSDTISVTIDKLKAHYTGEELRKAVNLEVARQTVDRTAWPVYTNDDEPANVTRKRLEMIQWAMELPDVRDRT